VKLILFSNFDIEQVEGQGKPTSQMNLGG